MARLLKVSAILIFISLCYWIFKLPMGDLTWTNCSNFQQKFLALGIWAPALLYVGYLASAIAVIPGTLLTMFAGLSFGLFWGTLLALTGINSGASLAFFLARHLGRQTVERALQNKPWFLNMQTQAQQKSFEFIILMRLIPLVPYTGLNLACGLLPIKFSEFLLSSLIGTLPGTFVYVYLGRTGCQIVELVLQRKVSLGDLTTALRWQLLLAFLLLFCLTLVPIFWRRHRQARSKAKASTTPL